MIIKIFRVCVCVCVWRRETNYGKRTNEVRSRNHCCRGKVLCIKHSLCRLIYTKWKDACALFHCHLWPIRLYHVFYFTLSHKKHDFRKNIIEHKKCVSIFSTNFTLKLNDFKKTSAWYYRKWTWVYWQSTAIPFTF